MKPTIWQLKNRIKFVEWGKHATWKHGRYQDNCKTCAIGGIMRSAGIELPFHVWTDELTNSILTRNNKQPVFLGENASITLNAIKINKIRLSNVAFSEMMGLSDAMGLNWLEFRDMEHYFEGEAPYAARHTGEAMLSKFENEHIKPYLWMIEERHLERWRSKLREEELV